MIRALVRSVFLLLMILVIILKKSITFVYQRKRDSINQLKNKCYENYFNYRLNEFYRCKCSKNCRRSYQIRRRLV